MAQLQNSSQVQICSLLQENKYPVKNFYPNSKENYPTSEKFSVQPNPSDTDAKIKQPKQLLSRFQYLVYFAYLEITDENKNNHNQLQKYFEAFVDYAFHQQAQQAFELCCDYRDKSNGDQFKIKSILMSQWKLTNQDIARQKVNIINFKNAKELQALQILNFQHPTPFLKFLKQNKMIDWQVKYSLKTEKSLFFSKSVQFVISDKQKTKINKAKSTNKKNCFRYLMLMAVEFEMTPQLQTELLEIQKQYILSRCKNDTKITKSQNFSEENMIEILKSFENEKEEQMPFINMNEFNFHECMHSKQEDDKNTSKQIEKLSATQLKPWQNKFAYFHPEIYVPNNVCLAKSDVSYPFINGNYMIQKEQFQIMSSQVSQEKESISNPKSRSFRRQGAAQNQQNFSNQDAFTYEPLVSNPTNIHPNPTDINPFLYLQDNSDLNLTMIKYYNKEFSNKLKNFT